jgi:hypothetical protein
MGSFALEWFELLNEAPQDIPLKSGQQVRIISQ